MSVVKKKKHGHGVVVVGHGLVKTWKILFSCEIKQAKDNIEQKTTQM